MHWVRLGFGLWSVWLGGLLCCAQPVFCQLDRDSTQIPTPIDTNQVNLGPDQATPTPGSVDESHRFWEIEIAAPPAQQPFIGLDAATVDWLQPNTTASLLEGSGALFVQRSQAGGGSPVIRGFEASRILLVLDGVRMNNAIYRSGHLQNIIQVDAQMLKTLQVELGPSSVRLGSDALGGAIRMHTHNVQFSKNDTLAVHGAANLRLGSAAGERTGHLRFNLAKKRFGSLTAFTWSSFGDVQAGRWRPDQPADWGLRPWYVQRINGQDVITANEKPHIQRPTGYDQWNLLQKFQFLPNPDQLHTLTFHATSSSDIPRYDRLTLSRNGQPRFADWRYGPQTWLMGLYQYWRNTHTRALGTLHLTAAHQSVTESRLTRAFGSTTLAQRTDRVQYSTLTATAAPQILPQSLRIDAQLGLDLGWNDVQSEAYSYDLTTAQRQPLDTRYPSGGSQMGYVAAFATYKTDLGPWTPHLGLRYTLTHLQSDFRGSSQDAFPFLPPTTRQLYGAPVGHAGISFRNFKENVTMRKESLRDPNDYQASRIKADLLFSSGFRSPNIDDLGKVFDSQPGSVILPNANLRPEYTYNLDFSLAYDWGEKLSCKTSWYHTWLRGNILSVPFAGADSILYDGVLSAALTSANAGRARIWGGHLIGDWHINRKFTLNQALGWTHGRNLTLAQPQSHIPPLYGRTGLHWAQGRWRAEAWALYNGPKRLADYSPSGEDNLQFATADGTPAWATANLRVGLGLAQGLNVSLACENILDLHYRQFASGISAPGRNFLLSLRYQW